MFHRKIEVNMKATRPPEDVVRAIRLVWDSLDSHLDHSVLDKEGDCTTCGDKKFHANCCREYAFIISVLASKL